MCVEILYLHRQELLSQEVIDPLLELVSAKKRERLRRFHFARDLQNGLLGELLVRYMISRRIQIPFQEIAFTYGAYQKPYVKGHPVFFNLSHSDAVVAAAVSGREIGIDVEKIKEIDLGIARRFFTENEYDSILRHAGRKEEQFFKIWTRKESFIKNIGTGLHMPLNHFEVLEDTVPYAGSQYTLMDLQTVSGYASAICLLGRDSVKITCCRTEEFAGRLLGDEMYHPVKK